MSLFRRSGSRRAELLRREPERGGSLLDRMRADGRLGSLLIALGFWLLASGILLQREGLVPWRPGQRTAHDIVARVDFTHHDASELDEARREAREREPRVYAEAGEPLLDALGALTELPARLGAGEAGGTPLPPTLDEGAAAALRASIAALGAEGWNSAARQFVNALGATRLVVLADRERREDLTRAIVVGGVGPMQASDAISQDDRARLRARLRPVAEATFGAAVADAVADVAAAAMRPTHALDPGATAEARHRAEAAVPRSAGDVLFRRNAKLVGAGTISHEQFELLRSEHAAFIQERGGKWVHRAGAAAACLLLTVALAMYTARYQPRVVRNHARGVVLALLLLSMLGLSKLAAFGANPAYLLGLAPSLLVGMILAIVYDQRYALGIGGIHAVLVTVALDQPIGFFIVVASGLVCAALLLDDLRQRGTLIRVGAASAVACAAASFAVGLLQNDPLAFTTRNALYAAAASLGCGFVVLGVLPFIERAFRITTSLTLLELADASHPLLRRLAIEAPGTYNHSLQVAVLAEEAATAIGADALLCRVGAYYHDVGKMNKAEYFVENQVDGASRHINLNPSVSLLVIVGHVKDGLELARQHRLPTSIFPFIQQHHGTTLVEYFFHQARTRGQPDATVSEEQYRYPGPKPKSREIAVLMLADASESACRAMKEPSPSRIESLVRDLAMKRLLDGQFDECDLTMRDLEMAQRAITRTLAGMYHGRLAYPESPTQGAAPPGSSPGTASQAV